MIDRITEAELVVLGLLAEKPRHGYDLEQTIRKRGMRDWTSLGFSSLYYLLDKLESEQLVERAKSEANTRKVYKITKQGVAACSQTAERFLTEIQPYNSSFLVGLANTPLLSSDELIGHLRSRGQNIEDRLNSVIAKQKIQQPLPDFVDAMFDYSISLLQAERIWLQKTVEKMCIMEKRDFKKELKEFYSPSSKEFAIVDVPKMKFLMANGHGDPNTASLYKDVVEALYSTAYTLKFASKKLGKDYSVMPLEGLWTADDLNTFLTRNKSSWKWTMMIMQPDWITQEMFKEAIEAVRSKKNPKALDLVRLEEYDEGKAVQIMHIGSYDEETPTLQKLHNEFMPKHNLTFNGDHHEIYIGDPRKSDPSKLKTILRQPVKIK